MSSKMLDREAAALVADLKKKRVKLVLAESCTGGMVAAALAAIPGVSEWLCGSFVVYRNESKADWLGVSKGLLKKHGAVSPEIALEMSRMALKNTTEAELSVAITGHLGPGAPKRLDGVIYISLAIRVGDRSAESFVMKERLPDKMRRAERQRAASLSVIRVVRSLLNTSPRRK